MEQEHEVAARADLPPSEYGRGTILLPPITQWEINRLLRNDLLAMEKNLMWLGKVVLQEIRTTVTAAGWRVMVKGRKHGRPVVAYLYADTFYEAQELTADFVERGILEWKPDRYPIKF